MSFCKSFLLFQILKSLAFVFALSCVLLICGWMLVKTVWSPLNNTVGKSTKKWSHPAQRRLTNLNNETLSSVHYGIVNSSKGDKTGKQFKSQTACFTVLLSFAPFCVWLLQKPKARPRPCIRPVSFDFCSSVICSDRVSGLIYSNIMIIFT